MKRAILLTAVIVAVIAAPTATASNAPVRLTFEKVNQFDGTWKGSVAGDIDGGLTTQILSLREAGPIWHVTFDWIVDAGEKSFTARLKGTVNTETGRVVMNGRVVEGYLDGARVAERGQLINASGDAVGTIRVMPTTAS